MAITPLAPGAVAPPVDLTEQAAGTVAIPNDLSEKAAGTVSIPNDLTEQAAGAVAIPNDLNEKAAGSVAIPNNLSEQAAGAIAIPNNLTEIGASAFPRSLCPTASFDFANELFALCGQPVPFADLFTYSRNTSASFINRRINCGKYEYFLDTDFVGDVENLALFSEQYEDAAWTKTRSSITANAAKAPNGTFTADKLTEDATAANSHYVQSTAVITVTNNETITAFVAAKAAERKWINIETVQGVTGKVWFNLAAGILGSSSGTGSPIGKIEPLGDGWYLCSVTVSNIGVAAKIRASIADADNSTSYNGDGVSGIFIWGAQLTETAKPVPYVKTLTVPVTETFTESLRLEFDPATGAALGYKDEKASTNIALWSESLDNAVWTKSNVTLLSNNSEAPDETLSADKIYPTTTGSNRGVFQAVVATTDTYSVSFHVKSSGFSWCKIIGPDGAGGAWFNVSSGVIGTVAVGDKATIKQMDDGYFRCTITGVGAVAGFAQLILSDSDNTATATAVGTNGIIVWGAQLEESEVATSYIFTEAAPVARAADDLTSPSAGIFNPQEYTMRAVGDYSDNSVSTQDILSVSDGTNNNRVQTARAAASGSKYFSSSNNVAQFSATAGSITANTTVTQTIAFKTNDFVGYLEGAPIVSDVVAVPLVDHNTIYFGSLNGTTEKMTGHIKSVEFWNVKLTDQEVKLI